MQTSAAIATAAVAQERAPVATLKVDWDADGSYSQAIDDLSARVESLTIDRQLATDLPDEVARAAGYSSAQLTATLSGDPTKESTNAGSYFSPFNAASALFGKRRRWRTCQAQIGFGANLLSVFTGKTSGLTVDSASRTATLDALDNAETMRGVVDLPMVTADNKGTFRPGLNSSWVVDYIARSCGYFAAPPRRANALFHASFAGSAYPTVGAISAVTGAAGEILQYGTGKFVQSVRTDPAASGYNLRWNLASSVSTNDGSDVFIECWYQPTSFANPSMVAFLSTGSASTPYIALWVHTDGKVHAETNYNTTLGLGTSSDTAISLNTWNYIAVQMSFRSTTLKIRLRVNGSTYTLNGTRSSTTGQPALGQLSMDARTFTSTSVGSTTVVPGPSGGYIEAMQVENYAYGTNEPGIGGTPGWNDAYVGNATIQPSLNSLTVTVPTRASAWEQVQQIAAAEFATVGFDESGNFTFYNRNRWTTAPFTTSQRTINATDSLTAIATSEAIDQVRNHVRMTATIATVNAAGWVWAAANVISIAASSSTTVTVDLGQPVYNLSTSVRYASTSGTTGQSQYRANRNRDGSGTAVSNLTFTVTTVAAQIATIVITNPNAFVAYLVTSAGFTDPQGTPSLALWGQPVDLTLAQQPDTTSTATTSASAQMIDISDAISISQHGDQLLELSGNPWLQDVTSLTTLANDLLARLKDPVPILDGLTIVGDPRLQLGDRVTIVEPTLGLNSDFFLTRIASTFDAGGFTQALTVRGLGAKIADQFNRTDSTTSLGTAASGQTWTAQAGTWGITGATAYVASGATDGQNTAVIDAGVSDCTVYVTMSSAPTGGSGLGLCVRSSDNNNHIVTDANDAGGGFSVYRRTAGAFTKIGSNSASGANGDVYSVTMSGSTLTFKRNGQTLCIVTESQNSTVTNHGLRGFAASGTATAGNLDNLSVWVP